MWSAAAEQSDVEVIVCAQLPDSSNEKRIGVVTGTAVDGATQAGCCVVVGAGTGGIRVDDGVEVGVAVVAGSSVRLV